MFQPQREVGEPLEEWEFMMKWCIPNYDDEQIRTMVEGEGFFGC
jgi:hypothetical protein